MMIARLLPLVLACAAPACADSWAPYPHQRVVSPNGKHYVVAQSKAFGEWTFEMCRRRDGAAPIAPAKEDRWEPEKVDVSRDPEDKLLSGGKLSKCPLDFRVLDDEPGAVLFETYGWVGSGSAFALLDAAGRLRWSVQLGDLFSIQEIGRFQRSVSSTWWYRGWWVDEGRQRIVSIAYGDLLREIDLKEGTVTTPGPEVLLTRFQEGPLPDRLLALEVSARLKPKGLSAVATLLLEDAAQPLEVRLRAAVALRALGEAPAAEKLFLEAIPLGQPEETRGYAIAHLPDILGEKAIPHLREAMRAGGDAGWGPAMDGFESLGEQAVPALVEMLGETKEPANYRGGAAHVLGNIRSAAALAALLEAISDPEGYVANAAANAAIAVGGPELDDRLAEILLAGSTQDSRLAGYFEDHPSAKAVKPLLAAGGRSKPDTYERRRIVSALKQCTGKDFGEDIEKWRTGLQED
ncbi:MAG: HEAT repeat domain-containing protein [Planctomycetes bacterium]|nr:HEAT repeat domain-containing protein [Planctomycetota bacterium]